MANHRATGPKVFPIRAALACAVALILAACQTASPYNAEGDPVGPNARPNFPTRGEPLAAAPQPPPVAPPVTAPAPPPPSSSEVRSTVLAPPLGAQAAPQYEPPPPPPPPVVVAAPPPPPPPPPPPVMRPVTTGRVVDADGPPRTHVVKEGQGLDAVARELGSTRAALAAANGLKEPYNLRVGQRIKGPPSRGKAYVVQSGDTLFAIARRFSVSAASIASANDMKVDDAIRPSQRLMLPSGFKDNGPTMVASAGPAPVPTTAAPPPRPTPPPLRPTAPPAAPPREYARPTPAPAQPPPSTREYARPPQTPPVAVRPVTPPAGVPSIIDSAPAPSAAQIRAAGNGRFVWPMRGRILDSFGPKPGNQKNDGVNIAASMNQSVRAAAGGQVVYAGAEVPEFGNLVLIRHENGFVTAYGHMARIMVRIQDTVSQGQEIGEAGQSGGVGEPQLHFEVRYAPRPADRPTPIDPTLVLPE